MDSNYKYLGYLKSLQAHPDPDALTSLEQIVFEGENLERWNTRDDKAEKEWKSVPVRLKHTDEGVLLLGHFEDIRRIDNLDRNEPRYWAPLSIDVETDEAFPLNCLQYPVVEITYRCQTSRAYPACQWSYPGGAHQVWLEPSQEWQTVAALIPHRGFPECITRFSIRLYAAWRSTESLEIARVRFRALLPEETKALAAREVTLTRTPPPQHYPLLEEFLPFGVYMNVVTAEQIADLLDIAVFDYWRLAFEDIARHHHNCVVVEGVQTLRHEDWGVLLEIAENFGLRLIPTFDWPMEQFEEQGDALIDRYIAPYADSKAILAWNVLDAPPEDNFQTFLNARDRIAAVDANHPMAIHMRQADAFPLFAPFFAASGFSYFKSSMPWAVGEALRAHLSLMGGQQFWVTAPAFVYASDAPDWNTSPQLRLMLNMSMANGARGWLAHTYHNTPVWVDGHYQRSLTGPFLTFSDLWAELGNRIGRLSVLAPLFLNARPAPPPSQFKVELTARKHPKTQLKEHFSTVSSFWLVGDDYYLFYIINNDTNQVSSLNLSISKKLPGDLAVYDTTALARSRAWMPSEHQRHFEMFPGQGQLFLIAAPEVCARWRDIIVRRMLLADQRQTRVDLELARQYGLDISEIEMRLNDIDAQVSMEGLNRVHEARERLFNLIYATPAICETRELLIKASSMICGCDEALSTLYGNGNTEMAHELGIKVMPVARMLTALRLRLRRGAGAEIRQDAYLLTQQCEDLIRDIWRKR